MAYNFRQVDRRDRPQRRYEKMNKRQTIKNAPKFIAYIDTASNNNFTPCDNSYIKIKKRHKDYTYGKTRIHGTSYSELCNDCIKRLRAEKK